MASCARATRRNRSATLSATAMPIPMRRSNATTPTNAAVMSTASLRRKARTRRISGRSISLTAAYTTSPASAASGKDSRSGAATTSTTATDAAAARLASWLDAPAATARAVRLSDDDTGNPPARPTAAFAPASERSS